jgi:hypothetical protein
MMRGSEEVLSEVEHVLKRQLFGSRRPYLLGGQKKNKGVGLNGVGRYEKRKGRRERERERRRERRREGRRERGRERGGEGGGGRGGEKVKREGKIFSMAAGGEDQREIKRERRDERGKRTCLM